MAPALGVDGAEPLAELEVVERLEVELRRLPDVLEHHVVVLAAGRDARLGDVGQPAQQRVERGAGLGLLGVGGLDLGRQLLGAGQQGGLLVALRLGHLAAEVLLLGPGPLEGDDRRPASLVGGQHLVDQPRVLPAGALGGADGLGVVSEQLQVQHPASVSSRGVRVDARRDSDRRT